MSTPPTGEQYTLHHDGAHGPVEAVITSVAAALRHLTVDGHDLVQGFDEHETPPFGCGIVLVPWPNRVRDGRWVHEGVVRQLDLTEVDRTNAIHGLLRNTPYQLVDKTADAVTLGAAVVPQHGYPFHLWTTVEYRLTGNGIRVTHSVTNLGEQPAPYAVGTHPFIRVGEHPVDELTITARTIEHVMVDERLNPVGFEPASNGWNLTDGRLIGELALDDAFRLEPDADGVTRTVLSAPDGSETEVWQDGDWQWLQLFITRSYPTAGGPVTAVAVEPMTAPADALNSGVGLRWIEPGATWAGSWGICRPA
ncbi:aldose 1-epimerase family protein [Microcella sp.]|uniref:aldose 1-epimerase family protein n=1 Tax=Microcella sp. TaxID=1913979 RepID=UPI00299F59AD|nr:aldose 1-epimerase family protein [Microcella sp.]MDX2024957.1 aldose 1-epimerase family protein [Microcella sp.]